MTITRANMQVPSSLEALRSRITALERFFPRASGSLPFGIPEIDDHLPGGALATAALHEVSGNGDAGMAASALFAAGILARTGGTVLWCAVADDIFAPGLACAGLLPDRVLHARAPDEKTVLLLMEEALRHPGLTGVLGELRRLPMIASRRLTLAVEKSGVIALALRLDGKPSDMQPTAAATRWRVTAVPSGGPPSSRSPGASPSAAVQGIGRARWQVELTRCRGGSAGQWIMEACDAQGVMRVPADLADRPAAAQRLSA